MGMNLENEKFLYYKLKDIKQDIKQKYTIYRSKEAKNRIITNYEPIHIFR